MEKVQQSIKEFRQTVTHYARRLGVIGRTIIIAVLIIISGISAYHERNERFSDYGPRGYEQDGRGSRGREEGCIGRKGMRNQMIKQGQEFDAAMGQTRTMMPMHQKRNGADVNTRSSYVSIDGNQSAYDISYASGKVDGFITMTDTGAQQGIMSGLQELQLKVEKNNDRIFFNGQLDDPDKVMQLLGK